ncbi:MAG: hypothetical protein IKX54_01230 [Lachnospiraceae bacterium]|nr:hypothetical protein [Lachnospiraceae bacterium]
MKIGRRYFAYHFQKTLTRLVVASLFALLCSWNFAKIFSDGSGLDAVIVMSIIMAMLIPTLEFRDFNTRRNLDTWFSLPIDRWKLAAVHLLNGAIHISIVVFLMFFCTISSDVSDPGLLPFAFLTILVFILLLYGFFSFVFLQANSDIDGCIFIVVYLCLPVLVNTVFIPTMREIFGVSMLGSSRTVVYGIPSLSFAFADSFSYWLGWTGTAGVALTPLSLLHVLLNILICVTAIAMLFVLFENRHAEKVGDISDSWFGYRTLIPLVAVLTLHTGIGTSSILFRLIYIFISYVIYRRSVMLKKSDWIVITVYAVLLGIMAVL